MAILINDRNKRHMFVFQELGIIFWKLRYPIVSDNINPIKLWPCLRLLLISSDFPTSLNDPFVKDVIRAMQINPKEVYALTIDQIKILIIPSEFSCYCWWIGTEVPNNLDSICLTSPSLSILKYDIQAKRDLWRQISDIRLRMHT
ncbi:DNA polymerase III subunit psi [Blochmannia endosymbiont of Camponotus sp. C-003]|uniref:DNA polymerase III subunit psi n=1 Tax=Blochmannia endosymbiont of Camponotus sp. C-003 TaxID=2945588 RepID=UPI002023BE21|nr:DNA polymerase III subunit psi [Blochmannia endosymbiont of Camponotus sp. C-003]URJ23127.1 DNA polymerase III subunit psi [Blochmannia endosymbiont of Camponotus sp. C-003]